MTFDFRPLANGKLDAVREAPCPEHGKHRLTIRAEEVRNDRTGVHARVAFGVDTTMLHDNTFNVGRDGDRSTFSNRLYGTRQTPGKLTCKVTETYPQATFEHEFMLWARTIWSQWVGSNTPALVHGLHQPIAPDFLLDGYVLREGGTILFAPPKSGKSYTGLLWAVSVDAAATRLWGCKQAKVLYINLERGIKSIQNRLSLVNRVLGLPPDRPLRMFNKRGASLSSIYDGMRSYIDREGIELVVLDSLTRGGFGNLNGNEEANEAMDKLNGICPSWVAIAHTPHANEGKIFGSQMFYAAMDVGVNVRKERRGQTLGVGFYASDTNDVPVPEPCIWAYEFDSFGLADVRLAEQGEFPEVENPSGKKDADVDRPPTLTQRVMGLLGGAIGVRMSTTNIAERLNVKPDSMRVVLNRGEKMGIFRKVETEGRETVWEMADVPFEDTAEEDWA